MDGSSELRTTSWTLTQGFRRLCTFYKPIVFHATFSILLEELGFLGDTRSRCELLVFAQANERRTKLTDALVRVLRHFLTPIGVTLPGAHDGYMRDSLLALAGHGDGHVLTVASGEGIIPYISAIKWQAEHPSPAAWSNALRVRLQ